MGALLHDPATVHHHDPVRLAHGGEPVRDDQRGPPAHHVAERFLHQPLALRVERAGRLVEQEDRRIAQDRASDRESLLLPAGQARAVLAQIGV